MDIIASSQECEEVIELTFRGHKFKVKRKYFHNDENNLDFTTEEQDNDLMWSLFRAYWERRGFKHFYDIDGYKKEQEPTSEDLERCVVEQMEADGDVDDFVRRGIDDIASKYAQLGAQWQREQIMKDAIETTIDGKVVKVIVVDE